MACRFLSFFTICFILSTVVYAKQNTQHKKEFQFKDGSVGYIVSDDGELYGVIDATGKEIVPQRYGYISIEDNLVYCKNSNIGPKYACALYFKDGQCKIKESDGINNLSFDRFCGKHIITGINTVYDDKGDCIYKFDRLKDSNGFIYLRNVLNDSIVIMPGKYTDISIRGGFIRTKIGVKEGLCDLDGNEIIPALQYGYILPYDNGFKVRLSKSSNGVCGYLDYNGKCIIPAINYSSITPLNNGFFKVKANDRCGVVDSLGNIKFMTNYHGLDLKQDENGFEYYETYLGNGRGKMSLDGTIIEEPKVTLEKKEQTVDNYTYTEIQDKNGLYGIIDSSGNQILSCDYSNIMYNSYIPGFKLFRNGYVGIADLNGNIIIPCTKYHDISVSYYSKTKKDFPLYYNVDYLGKCGLCDDKGKEIVEPLFDDIRPNNNGTATAQIGLSLGIIDFSGNVIVPFEYTSVSLQDDGNYSVRLLNKQGLCNQNGRVIIPPRYTSIKKITIRDGEYKELYKVNDGETVGLYTLQGEMLFPTGLFKNASLYKKGEVLSTDPLDGVNTGLMGMLKVAGTSSSNFDETKFGNQIYIKAFNDFKDGVFYYYDLKGKLLYDTNKEKDFDKYFDLAQQEFNKRKYKKAIDYYKQALSIRQDGVTCYNIGAAYYNIDKYKDAIKYLEMCISLKSRQSVIDDAKDLIIDCEIQLQHKQEQRLNLIFGIFGSVLDVASIVMQTNTATTSYNYNSSNFALPPYLNPQVYAQNAKIQIEAQMEDQKNQFLVQFRNNYRFTMGREPSYTEEMEAYTQFLQGMNAAYSESNFSSNSSFESSNYSSNSSDNNMSSGQTSTSSKCGLCSGTGKIEDHAANYGITDKKWCSECGEFRINGHYHKTCPSCNGKGYR